MAATHDAGIRDVADFHVRWLEFRPLAVQASGSRALSTEQRDIVTWLIMLADRVGEWDVAPPASKPPYASDAGHVQIALLRQKAAR